MTRWKSKDMAANLIPPKKGELKKETANQITRNVLRIANFKNRCVAYRINNVGVWDEKKGMHRKGNTEKGLPDIVLIYEGRYIGIEVKAGSDRLSEDQKKRKFEIERAGGVYFECRSTDDFIRFFDSLTFKNN